MTTKTEARIWQGAGLISTISGLVWSLGAWRGGDAGLYVPVAMMNICVGMMFLTIGHYRTKKPPDKPHKQ